MRTPRPAGTPIDKARRSTWQKRFESYRYGITEAGINDWLNQFSGADKDAAARLLDTVEFISAEQLHAAFRSLLAKLPGWHTDPLNRRGNFAFVPFSSSAGESGDSMLHEFRLANNLNNRRFDSLFIGRSDLLRSGLGADDTVVFLDDFVGTGNQAVTAWQNMFQELTTQIGNIYFVTVSAYQIGSDRIRNETRMQLLTHRSLGFKDNLFHNACDHFSTQEKSRLLHYCGIASPDHPRGFGDCGLVIVLYHQCPNNTLAVLHATSRRWVPLFPRS
ncbi:MAG: phosphoribosyltransferase-like protein [Syntrophales bacterium]